MVLSHKNEQVCPTHLSKNFEKHMELLLIENEDKSRYVYIKDLNRFLYNKTKHKDKNTFYVKCLKSFSSE